MTHARHIVSAAVAVLCLFAALPEASALTPDQVYAKVSPSVVVVYSKKASSSMQGSGIVVGPGKVITNCHVIRSSDSKINVTSDQKNYSAALEYADKINDVCQLSVLGLAAPGVATSKGLPKIGQRVYAIGAPRGLDKTLSEGLVSGLRQYDYNSDIIQISVPITHGSSGGALVDENGILVGITTSGMRDGNLNFAMPATLVRTIETRGRTFLVNSTDKEDAAYETIRPAISGLQSNLSVPKYRFNDKTQEKKFKEWLRRTSVTLQNNIPDDQVRNEFVETVWYEATRAGLAVDLVLGIIAVESNFKKDFVSSSGGLGYMGVPSFWLRKVGDGNRDSLFDTRVNLRYGCTIIRMKIEEYRGELAESLNAYKGYPTNSFEYPNKVQAEWTRFE